MQLHSLPAVLAFFQPGEPAGSAENLFYLALAISLISLGMAFWFSRYVVSQDAGTPQMQRISNAIKAGAEAFMRRQNRTILLLAAVLAAIIFIGYYLGKGDPQLALRMTFSFILGALCSTAAGFSGMWVSIRSNIRVASAARS
ncbi:MAG: sodium/proton-translocating pyrophosphatase, partial [Bryobacteraceae bacterium]